MHFLEKCVFAQCFSETRKKMELSTVQVREDRPLGQLGDSRIFVNILEKSDINKLSEMAKDISKISFVMKWSSLLVFCRIFLLYAQDEHFHNPIKEDFADIIQVPAIQPHLLGCNLTQLASSS